MKTINTYINEKLRLTTKQKYTCQPKDKYELREIILQRIEDEGNECDLNDIDVSKITDMSLLFDAYGHNAKIFQDFNGDVSMWDVSNVKNMHGIFTRCSVFNCDLSKWNVSNVLYMGYMFYNCEKFNQDLDSWNVSNVKTMVGAFEHCPTQPTWYDKDKWENII